MSYKALPDGLHIKDSSIAGQGVFTKVDIASGINLGRTHLIIDDIIHRTPLGGFINHSDDPNCLKYYEDGFYFLQTIRKIKAGEELFLKYTFYEIDK